MSEYEDKIFTRALEKYGIAEQLEKAIEECGELIVEISHFKSSRSTRAKLAKEVADVEIMCAQIRLIIGNALVSMARNAKVERLRNRIERG